MSGKKRDSSVVDVSDSDGEIGVSPPEKLASDAREGTSSMLRTRKKRKATTPLSYSAPSPKMFWSKTDELVLLQGIIDYQKEKGVVYSSDSAAFFKFIKDDTESKFSKDQVMRKIGKLKAKFQDNLVKEPTFTVAHDAKMFDLSLAIWGKEKTRCLDGNRAHTKDKAGASVEHEGVTNGELENDDGSAKDESDDQFPSQNVEKSLEDESGGKKSQEDVALENAKPKKDDGSGKANSWDGGEIPSDCVDKHVEKETGGMEDEDELCVLQNALEETMFQGLSKSAQKLMFQNLRSLGAKERKELSDEWKALLVEEIQLKIKKQRFMAKLTDAVVEE